MDNIHIFELELLLKDNHLGNDLRTCGQDAYILKEVRRDHVDPFIQFLWFDESPLYFRRQTLDEKHLFFAWACGSGHFFSFFNGKDLYDLILFYLWQVLIWVMHIVLAF